MKMETIKFVFIIMFSNNKQQSHKTKKTMRVRSSGTADLVLIRLCKFVSSNAKFPASGAL